MVSSARQDTIDKTARDLYETQTCIRDLTKIRNDLMAKRRKQGATFRQIASEVGLSHTAVAKILGR